MKQRLPRLPERGGEGCSPAGAGVPLKHTREAVAEVDVDGCSPAGAGVPLKREVRAALAGDDRAVPWHMPGLR